MNHLGLLAKHWTPGRVKTRLAVSIDPLRAAMWHEQSFLTLAKRFADLGDVCTVWLDPWDQHPAFSESLARASSSGGAAASVWRLQPQVEGDLGRRLQSCFEQSFASGAERVVLLGADSPDIPREYLVQAFTALDTHDVVLGPAEDGGYYLIGARGRVPPCLQQISWGTASVWSQTVAQLHASGTSWMQAPLHYDIDRMEDLVRFANAQASDPNDLILLELRNLAQRIIRETSPQ